ncbi:hypothetical protein WOLCODRAFT_135839 [Wolfiporia cocos MD-104 SS10]|uniref:Uncharacterized protein n=1 Tax=Wolfiporia cocos (strain MD-104) TaxID=742152 RepID=A0A2H3JP26_WOLCO|nr:hypothetical protein WOLCODRAFT_135839 [Wolfiporia cocos MD-104 SS10]
MYEEVCLQCGRPVLVDGRAYCSDECESLDATSPSISTTSSAVASPYLHSNSGPGTLADVPALVSSALGRPLAAHHNRLSISSSSTSSAAWSSLTDDEEDVEIANPVPDDEYGYNLGAEGGSKSATSLGHFAYHARGAGLSYARRPSSTNNRSTIPTLARGTSSPSGVGSPLSGPAPYIQEDDFSDVPSTSSVSSAHSSALRTRFRHARKSSDALSYASSEDPDNTLTSKSKRNRASLPAYFSLLTSSTSSSSTTRTQRLPSSLNAFTAVTRSLHSSPPTPRVANPIINPITAYSQAHARPQAVEATPRGRGRKRDPEARSTSSRRSPSPSPPRQSRPCPLVSPPPCAHHHVHVGAQARARLDSIEKVTDWVSSSPVMQSRGRTLTRRNSSPPAKPRFEAIMGGVTGDDDLDAVREVLARSLHLGRATAAHDGRRRRDSTRGRRRADELDEPPYGADGQLAPGYGSGRSGLRARERERGRAMVR